MKIPTVCSENLFPKALIFNNVSDEELAYFVELINNRPRKRLGFKTPNEVFQAELEKLHL